MSDRISADDVRYVAHLARLDLTLQEIEKFTGELDAVLAHVEDLNSLDLTGVEPMTQAVPATNVLRTDEPRPSLSTEDALAGAPQSEGGRFRVPRIGSEEP